MMTKAVSLLRVILCTGLLAGSTSSETLLDKIQDSTISCDYLIVCPETMRQPALRLAEHRNGFAGDDVRNAHVACLENIIIEFNGSDFKKRNETLWQALKWACGNWNIPPKYLVLIGDDTYEIDTTDSTAYSIGRMPTWYSKGKVRRIGTNLDLTITDDFYTSVSSNKPLPEWDDWFSSPIYIGRIPAQSTTLCSLYVEKVIRYDLYDGNRSWKNRIIAIADDNYQGSKFDPVAASTPFQSTCDRLAALNDGFFFRKEYLSAFPSDQFYSKPEAKRSIIATFNEGAGIVYFFGHGNKTVLTDEQVLQYSDFDRFENDAAPLAFFSFTSNNGGFLASDGETMCKRFLFKEHGGCIAYFASTTETYANANEMLGKAILTNITQHQHYSIGQQIFEAKKAFAIENTTSYYLHGDPALQILSTDELPIELHSSEDSSAIRSVTLSVADSGRQSDTFNYYIEFSFGDSIEPLYPNDNAFVRDSVFAFATGTFSNRISIEVPPCQTAVVKATAFSWNDATDGHTSLELNLSETSAAAFQRASPPIVTADISFNNSILTLPASTLFQKTGMLKIYDLTGRMVYSTMLPNGRSRIDLKRGIPSSGSYLLFVDCGKIKMRKSIMIIK